MNQPSVTELYQEEAYPAMSHPPAHPSVIAATALLGGLRLPAITQMRILEIGCSSGHHILPIAEAYPQAQITAIDFSPVAIQEAQRLADVAGLSNIKWICADLTQWQAPEQAFDCIIAHGFLSWVSDPVKSALLNLCQRALAKNGVAMISYNTQPGWALRQPLREMALALSQLDATNSSAISTMQWMERALHQRDDAYGQHLLEIVRDAQAKGEQQLQFDDLGPINDPCYFSQFVHWCEQSGLRYIGDSDRTLAQTSLLDSTAQKQLHELSHHPLLHEQMSDFLTGRTFRCSVVCRSDAGPSAPTPEELAQLSIEPLMPIPPTDNDATDQLAVALQKASPSCLTLLDLISSTPQLSLSESIPILLRMLHLGMIRLRKEGVSIAQEMPSHPRLSALNTDHLQTGKPIVDAYHRPCRLSPSDQAWLQQCNGTKSFEQLMEQSPPHQRESCHALLAHLHQRGLLL